MRERIKFVLAAEMHGGSFEVIKVGEVTTKNIVKTPHTKPVTLDELPTQYFGRNVDGQRGPGGAGKERGLD